MELMDRNKNLAYQMDAIQQKIEEQKRNGDVVSILSDDPSLKPTEQNQMLQVLSASMQTSDVALRTNRAEAQRLEGPNLLLPGSRFNTQVDQNKIKLNRVNKILSELRNSIQTGQPLTPEVESILKKVLPNGISQQQVQEQ